MFSSTPLPKISHTMHVIDTKWILAIIYLFHNPWMYLGMDEWIGHGYILLGHLKAR